jgi:hypothetical protein
LQPETKPRASLARIDALSRPYGTGIDVVDDLGRIRVD